MLYLQPLSRSPGLFDNIVSFQREYPAWSFLNVYLPLDNLQEKITDFPLYIQVQL